MRYFWVFLVLSVPTLGFSQSSFINGITHNGETITCDLPGSQHIQNIGS